jgi:hypothetical protein
MAVLASSQMAVLVTELVTVLASSQMAALVIEMVNVCGFTDISPGYRPGSVTDGSPGYPGSIQSKEMKP